MQTQTPMTRVKSVKSIGVFVEADMKGDGRRGWQGIMYGVGGGNICPCWSLSLSSSLRMFVFVCGQLRWSPHQRMHAGRFSRGFFCLCSSFSLCVHVHGVSLYLPPSPHYLFNTLSLALSPFVCILLFSLLLCPTVSSLSFLPTHALHLFPRCEDPHSLFFITSTNHI